MYKETMIMYIKENKYTLQELNEMAQAIEDLAILKQEEEEEAEDIVAISNESKQKE